MTKPILDSLGRTEADFLNDYDITAFEQPSVTVDMLLMTISNTPVDNYRKLAEKSLRVLLIRRNEHPALGQWALPGGFIRMNEDLETAAYRELKEETQVDNVYLEQLYTYGAVQRDPRGRIISTAYMALVNENEIKPKAGSDAAEAKWFDLSYALQREEREMTPEGFVEHKDIAITLTSKDTRLNTVVRHSRTVAGKQVSYTRKIIENEGLSFDHGLIIQQGMERLRNKLEYTDVVFHLLPDLFTLTELQKTYETILGKTLLKANFRRKVAKMVVETNQSTKEGGHRPSKLFTYNPRWQDL